MSILCTLLYTFIFLIGAILTYIYLKLKSIRQKWEKQGVEYLGNSLIPMLKTSMEKKSIWYNSISQYEIVKNKNLPYMGYAEIMSDGFIIRDVNILKSIFIKDFDHFTDRRSVKSGNDPHFERMVIMLNGEEWKVMRNSLSPTFTTGKIKRMYHLFQNSGNKLIKYLTETIEPNGALELEIQEMVAKYTIDVIAEAAFGIDSKAFVEKTSVFESMSRNLVPPLSVGRILGFILTKRCPQLAYALGLRVKFMNQEPDDYFSTIIKESIKYREQNGVKGSDFLQLILDTRDGLLKKEEESELSPLEKEAQLNNIKGSAQFDDDSIIAQLVLFFLAGFDTTKATITFTLYELAKNPEIQEKLFQEILSFETDSDDKVSYENINNMEYLDKVFSEALRMHPPGFRIERVCSKNYTIPETQIKLEKGCVVHVPVCAIHHDPHIYPNPEKFDPERFSAENKSTRSPYAYIPFGHGPRNCIGMRFGLIQTKLALIKLIKHFKIEPCAKTPIPVVYDASDSLAPKDGMWLKISTRN